MKKFLATVGPGGEIKLPPEIAEKLDISEMAECWIEDDKIMVSFLSEEEYFTT